MSKTKNNFELKNNNKDYDYEINTKMEKETQFIKDKYKEIEENNKKKKIKN